MTPQELIPRLAALLGVEPAAVRFLQRSQNSVYEFTDQGGERRIARVTADSHQSHAEILGELEWISFLHQSGLSVCPPLAQADGTWVRPLPGPGESGHVVIFAKAPGRPVAKTDLNPRLYRLHGQHLGRLHALARRSPAGSLAGRRRWEDERFFTSDIPAFLPAAAQQPVLDRFQLLRTQLASFPATRDDVGPVHLDVGYYNFFLAGDRLEIFDFDNCTVAPFAADIAAALYSSVFHWLRREFPGDRSAFEHPKSGRILEEIWTPFRAGYLEESPWPGACNDTLPAWFQLLYLRNVVHAFRMQHPITDPRIRAALEADLENIRRGHIPLQFDFQRGAAVTE